ncbi:HEAT repeat-containing protein 6-like [Limulus polyphemus]|uniref:HEAT repeat-containing protein 6-like n=1 Tax=Limulus polyphemus TaxID=6850 RepID=A0ABM1RZI7_LIMPO|nr:HEAT repeat-containing protein 6-like [Limulus polyphemus]
MTSNPTCLYPTPVSQFVPSLPCLSSQVSRANSRPANQKKRTKKKPDVMKGGKEQSQKEDDQLSEGNVSDSGYTYASQSHGTSARSNSFYFPSWSRTSSSESDYSDSETNQVLKLRSLQAKVRQCTFSALQVIVKVGSLNKETDETRICTSSDSEGR